MNTLPDTLTKDSDHTRYVNSDYERSRATLLQLLEEGKEALALAMEITRNTEHPRAVEAMSGLLKNIADINDKLMDLNKKNKEFYERKTHRDAPVDPTAPQQITNNFLFSGTVADLQKKLAGMTDQPMIDITPTDD